jgi:hypothetical protein
VLLNEGLYDLQENLTAIHGAVFDLKNGINETAQLIYGIPMMYTSTWLGISSQGELDPYTINQIVNNTVLESTSYFGGNALSLGYYSTFARIWNESFANPSIINPFNRAQFAVDQSVPIFLQNVPIDMATQQLMLSVTNGLNVTTWTDDEVITELTLNLFASQIPDTITAYVGVSPQELLRGLYNLSPTPMPDAISNLTITLFTKSLTSPDAPFAGLISTEEFDASIPDLVRSVYDLGSSPTESSIWAFTSRILAGGTAQSLSGSPLFTVNESSLYGLLLKLNNAQNVDSEINGVVESQNIDNYPFILSSAFSQNFVSPKNNTMIAFLDFDSPLNSSDIVRVKSSIEDSSLYEDAEVYVTGNSVFAEDLAEIFDSVETLTVIAGIVVSLLIAAILFRSPIAAIFPLLIAGVSIMISYPAIYLGVVVIGQGTISFMTPILTTLLMLGLGVDYSVILLRRTREERLAGKDKEDSVGVSTRWAGQAIITAGVAVITSYIVMAVAQVPMFSDVGVSIAIGVAILLIVAITLVPALEMLIGESCSGPD